MYKEIIDYAKRNNLTFISNRKKCKIAAYIKLAADGTYHGIVGLDKKVRKDSLVPDLGTYAATASQSNFVIEKMKYIFDNNEKKHKCYVDDIKDGAKSCNSIRTIYAFMEKYESDKSFRQLIEAEIKDSGLKKDDVVSWMIDGTSFEDMEDDWSNCLLNKIAALNARKKVEKKNIISSISGTKQESIPPEAAPEIKNVPKFGISRQCYVASAKYTAYCSYGFEKATGFQMGIEDAKLLATGFKELLTNPDNHNADFKLLFFYDHNIDNIIKESLELSEEDDEDEDGDGSDNVTTPMNQANTALAQILSAVKCGNPPIIPEEIKNARYYMCKFDVPSAGRYFLSGEEVGSCGDLLKNLYAWYDDTKLLSCKFDKKASTSKTETVFIRKPYNILWNCVGNRNAKEKGKAVNDEFRSIMNPLLYAVYHNTQIPNILYRRALKYASLSFVPKKMPDGTTVVSSNIKTIYAQIIKCYLIRKGYKIMSELSNNVNPAYACGKLFAVYEQLQLAYSGYKKLNKNLAQCYFSGCMKQPGIIFPKISELSIVYLHSDKIKDGTRIYLGRLIGEITKEIGEKFPTKFSVDEQGMFILGYYQQKTRFLTKD